MLDWRSVEFLERFFREDREMSIKLIVLLTAMVLAVWLANATGLLAAAPEANAELTATVSEDGQVRLSLSTRGGRADGSDGGGDKGGDKGGDSHGDVAGDPGGGNDKGSDPSMPS